MGQQALTLLRLPDAACANADDLAARPARCRTKEYLRRWEVVQREMRGGGSSVSIPIGFGIRYRTGHARAHSVVIGTQLVAEDAGELTVTSQRALFSGQKKTLEFRYDRLVALHQYTDGLRLGVTNRQAASLFRFGRGQSPTIAAALITRAASALQR